MKPITTEELQSMISEAKNILLVNTLDEQHFESTQILDSVNVPLSQEDFATRVEEVATSKLRPIVVYCASEDCSSSTKAAKKLDDAGFAEVYDYEGGAKAWQEAGQSLGV